jgi:aryl-alcohol dehydrogenase-like predicted oxidoreductase
MEQIKIGTSGLTTSRIGLGTWAIGGSMWGGTADTQSIATIRSAVERGVTLIDTAPVYGFGHSEEIVGKALAKGSLRDKVQIATKVGVGWRNGAPIAIPVPLASAKRSRIRYAGCRPMSLTFIRSTGPT